MMKGKRKRANEKKKGPHKRIQLKRLTVVQSTFDRTRKSEQNNWQYCLGQREMYERNETTKLCLKRIGAQFVSCECALCARACVCARICVYREATTKTQKCRREHNTNKRLHYNWIRTYLYNATASIWCCTFKDARMNVSWRLMPKKVIVRMNV